MEKKTPHNKLEVVRALLKEQKVSLTKAALDMGGVMGFARDDILAVVEALTPKDFYKSMTTYNDHTVWQDVYRPSTPKGDIYLKLTITAGTLLLIVSFKEL